MDHDHSYFSFMATYRCKRLFQTTKLHTQSRLQNCTLKPDYRIAHSYFISTMRHIYKDPNLYILLPESWVSSTVFEKVGRMFILVMTWNLTFPPESSELVTTSAGCSFPSVHSSHFLTCYLVCQHHRRPTLTALFCSHPSQTFYQP